MRSFVFNFFILRKIFVLAIMNFHMVTQLGLKTKGLTASFFGAFVSVFSYMKPLVLIQVTVLGEGFQAMLTLVWFFA